MSDRPEESEGSGPSSADPIIYVLSKAIRSSMQRSMAMLAETLQQNNLLMANTIREGFVNRTSISEDPHTAPV